MKGLIKLLFDKMRHNLILIVLDFTFVFLFSGLLNKVLFREYNWDYKTVSNIIAFELGLTIAFVLLHFIFKLSKKDIVIKTILYLLFLNASILSSVYLIGEFIIIPIEYRFIEIILISIVSYELSSLTYKLLAKTKIINKIRTIKKTKEE